jgi:chorismate synthase
MLRFLTAGESHGQCLTAILEGVPAGLPLTAAAINADLARRQRGHGRGGRMRIECDEVQITAGVRGGRTLGSPVALLIQNRDWVNWGRAMAVEAPPAVAPVTTPRPGHADLAGALKYGHRDIRNVLERASARETAARVAVGAVARRLLAELGARVVGHVTAIGPVEAAPWRGSLDRLARAAEVSPVRCGDSRAARRMVRVIDRAIRNRDTVGGVVEVRAEGLPPGLGSHVHWDRKLDGRIAAAVLSIQAFKGVTIGDAFAVARAPGSRAHDEIFWSRRHGFYRRTNRAGGLEGGMTNGEPLVVRAAVKPVSTLMRPLASVDLETKRPVRALRERSDVCMVPAAAVVAEAAVAVELARAFQEKFGGDSLDEMRRNLAAYRAALRSY